MKTKKDTGLTTEKFKTALSVVKTALVEGIKYKFGDNAGKIAEFIFTKPELIASMAAMGDKKAKEGELNSADYAGLVKDILAYGILTAELGGATASTIAVAGVVISPLAILMGVAGAALFAYEHQNDISTIIDNYNKLVGSGV